MPFGAQNQLGEAIMGDSCSLTPPLSPQQHIVDKMAFVLPVQMKEYIEVPFFSCCNADTTLMDLPGSYLKTRLCQKLSEGEIMFSTTCPSVVLYGRAFATESALLTQQVQLFSLTKQKIKLLKLAAQNHHRAFEGCVRVKAFECRYEICEFLMFVKNFLLKIHSKLSFKPEVLQTTTLIRNFLYEFSREMQSLLLFAGRLSSVPGHIYLGLTGNRERNSAGYEYYHLCLDIWWSSVEIFHILHMLCTKANVNIGISLCTELVDDPRNFFVQVSLLTVWDLCCLAYKNYVNSDVCFTLSSPFPCCCAKEFWVLLMKLLDSRQLLLNDGSFWCSLQQIFQHMMNVTMQSETNIARENITLNSNDLPSDSQKEFFLWLLVHLAPLYKYDESGKYIHYQEVHSCASLIKYVAGNIFFHETNVKDEKSLRKILSLLLPLTQLWGPCGDILLKTTDFFLQKINEQFNIPSKELQLPYLYKNGKCWLLKLQDLCGEYGENARKETSFHMYLKILSSLLKQSGSSGHSLWLQFRGRICSRFTSKKFSELSEVGLQNFFSVLLTVACCVPLEIFEEFFLKICSLTNMVQNALRDIKRGMIFLKAMFALILLYQQHNRDTEKISSVVVRVFDAASDNYSHSSNSVRQVGLSDFLLLYAESMQSVFENSSGFALSEHILISSGFLVLLKSCQNELCHFLKIILNILLVLKKSGMSPAISEDSDGHFLRVLKNVFQHILPFVESCAEISSPPSELAGVAAQLTYLAFNYSTSISACSSHTHISLFKHFVSGPSTDLHTVCGYLSYVLKGEPVLFDDLMLKIPDMLTIILQSWVKCCMLLIPPSSEMRELTHLLLQHQEVCSQFPVIQHMSFGENEHHDVMCMKFFFLIGRSYKSCESLQEKSQTKEKFVAIFKNLPVLIGNKMKQNLSSPLLAHVYRLTGYLIEYCAVLLHMKFTNESVLPNLIDTLLLPHVVFPKEKFLPATLSRHAKEHLPSFLKGLAELDYRTDACIRRKLKDVVIHYLSNLSVSNNPVIALTVDAALCQNELKSDFFHFAIDAVKEEVTSNITNSSGFYFFTEVLKKTNMQMQRKICEGILKDMLLLLLRHEGPYVKPLKELLEFVFTFLKAAANADYRKQLVLPTCQDIVREKLAWSQYKVFRLLEYLTKHFPGIMSEMIPFLSKHIEYLECQRGCGFDAGLRRELKNFVDTVQKGLPARTKNIR